MEPETTSAARPVPPDASRAAPDGDQGGQNSTIQDLRARLAAAEKAKAWKEASDLCVRMLDSLVHVSSPAEALAIAEHARNLAELSDDLRALGLAYNAHGVLLLNLGDLRVAERLLKQARGLLMNCPHTQETAMARLNLVACLRIQDRPIDAFEELRECQDLVTRLRDLTLLRSWFSENALLLSRFVESVPDCLPDLAGKARSSFFAAMSLLGPRDYRGRLTNQALYRGALQHAHRTSDSLLGLTTCLAFQHGYPQDAAPLSTQPSEVLNHWMKSCSSDSAGLLCFFVDSKSVFAVLWTNVRQGVFLAPDFSASTLDTLVVSRWYGPCQEFRASPTRQRRNAVSASIKEVAIVLAQLADSARDVKGSGLLDAVADLPVKTLFLLPHRHLAAVPLDSMPLRVKPGVCVALWQQYQTATHTGEFSRRRTIAIHGRPRIGRFLVLRDPDLDLPSTSLETGAIRSGTWHAEVRLSTETTVSEFRSLLLSCDALHIGCHASLAVVKDLEPSIRLADRCLTINDLVGLDLSHIGLAVSASCDSALAHIDPIAARRGFMDMFASAGCRNVIGSMWPVDDLATGLFFRTFYNSLASSDLDIVAAFNGARAWLRECPLSEVLRILRLAGFLTSTDTELEWDGIRSLFAELGHTVSAPDQNRRLFDDPVYWSSFVLTVS